RKFSPKAELDLGLEPAKKAVTADKHPEALRPNYIRDDAGKIQYLPDGRKRVRAVEYALMDTPLAKEAAKGIRGDEARENAVTSAYADKLFRVAREAEKNPDIKAGAKWYSTARTRLKKIFGDDTKLFAELLGATSARTPVDTNFRFALDAYNTFKSGGYDAMLSKYREGKQKWATGDIADFKDETGNQEPTRGQFLDWWITKHDLVPTQSSGKKFGMNSRQVLRVLDGSWAEEVQGPKTPNFTGNLSGQTFEATIDVWAARLLHRLGNEGNTKRWRILPESETGVTDADFALGQAAFRKAADKLGMKPDALQAILWFFEKHHWEEQGWTRGAGAEKSDFNTLLAKTERDQGGKIAVRKPQTELAFSLEPGDIRKR